MADYYFQMDTGGDEFYLVAIFRDRETYLANADSLEQHERYLQFRSFLVADPEWHDGDIVSATGPWRNDFFSERCLAPVCQAMIWYRSGFLRSSL